MSFPRYPAYKDSGVQWIAVLPAHWDLRRFKSIFAERIDKSESGDELLLSVSAYTGVTPRSELVDDGDHLSRAESLEGYKRCFKDDLVMNIMLAWNRGLAFTQFEGIVSPAYCVFRVIDDSHPKFLNYLVRSDEYTAYFKAFSSGVIDSRLRIYPETFGALFCALPPTEEQADIANFLDHETTKIDALVAEQERLIELLKEKRQAVISYAVTKGLDPSVPMKDSGVEWLGQVPEHWEICALKRIADLKSGESITADDIEEDGEFPVFGGNGLRGFTTGFTHEGTYALVGRQGALCGNVNYATGKFWASEHAVVATPKAKLETYWLGELMRAMNLNQYSVSAAQPGLSVEIVGNLHITVPPVSEQGGIANFLKHETAKIDALVAEAHTAISLFQERRTALISAAVTGQIDVRGFASPRTDV